jgi:flagellar protein FliO/FliZ
VSLDLYTRFLLALVAVLALLAAFAWAARRFGFAGRSFAKGGRRRLAVVEMVPIDAKRRLVLLRRDQTEHLIVLGVDSAVVIESGIGGPGGAAQGERPGTVPAGITQAGDFAAVINQETDS